MDFENPRRRIAVVSRALLVLLLAASGIYAHGLGVGVDVTEDSVTLRCRYADGTFPDAEALIYSPEQPNKTFLIGRTDSQGVCSFVPNATGAWHVVVDDGMGHRKVLDVNVDGSAFAISDTSSPILPRLVFGALLLAALGFLVGRVFKKQRKPRESTAEGRA